MKKNVAGQFIGAQMITAADGTAFTGTVTVYVTGNAGTQAIGSVGSGICTHEGNGFHTYAPAQAETNYDHVAFTFIGTGAIPATVQLFTGFPQTVDNATNITAIKTKTDFLPSVAAGSTGGIPVIGTGTNNFKSNASANMTFANTSIATVTNLTNLPAITAGWLTATGIAASALNGKGDWNVGKTGYSLTATTGLGNQTANITGNLSGSVGSVTGAVGSVTGAVGSVTGLTPGNLDVAVSTRLAGTSYTAPDNATVALIAGYTDSIESRLPAALVGGRMASNAEVVGDKTGYSLTATTGLGNQTADITGSLSGAVGSVTGAVGSVAAGVTVTTNNDKTGYALSASGVQAVWDYVVEGSMTAVQAVRGIFGALLNKLSGAATATIVIRDKADTKDRITAAVDGSGNRTSVTTDLT